jgi:hypothetical protein
VKTPEAKAPPPRLPQDVDVSLLASQICAVAKLIRTAIENEEPYPDIGEAMEALIGIVEHSRGAIDALQNMAIAYAARIDREQKTRQKTKPAAKKRKAKPGARK